MTELPKAFIDTSAARLSFDGQEVPGVIAENGIIVTPGDCKNLNRVQVTFFCGEVSVSNSHQVKSVDGPTVMEIPRG